MVFLYYILVINVDKNVYIELLLLLNFYILVFFILLDVYV